MDEELKWLVYLTATICVCITLVSVVTIYNTSEKEACIKASINARLSNEQLVTLCSGAK